ncbi:alpha/beta hydrolase [Actinocorallia sp. B10E7]|uniref:alpha/beta fold hydrolase n=1 Tax=Actinocorallia sp. B10E7 TaxID=3153558 RepID=UPI00325CFE6B
MRTVLIEGSGRALVRALAREHRAAGARVLPEWPEEGAPDGPDEVWFVPLGPQVTDPGRVLREDREHMELLLERCAGHGSRFVYVAPDPGGDGVRETEARLRERLTRAGVDLTVLRAGPVLSCDGPPAGLALLDDAVRWICSYVRERAEDHLKTWPLRVLGSPDAVYEVAWADETARRLVSAQQGDGTARVLPLPTVLSLLGKALDCRIVLTRDPADLTAIDRLLASRLGASLPTAGPSRPSAPADEERLYRHFRSPRAARPPAESVADGTPVVIVNALGQGPGYWSRLRSLLGRRRRTVLFSPRGAGLEEHLAELEDFLDAEGIGAAHLVGWCTGAKTVLAHRARRPGSVRSITLLNPAFRHPGRPAELDSPYEQRLDSVADLLARDPRRAGRVLRILAGGLFEERTEDDEHRAAERVLATPHPGLEPERRLPFADEDALLLYAAQLKEFWTHDALGPSGGTEAPMLVIAGTLDEIVTLGGIREAAGSLPGARLVELESATHYAMFERAEEVAALIEELTTTPGAPATGDREC